MTSGDHGDDPALSATLADSASVERYCPSCDRSYGGDTRTCPSDGTALVELREDVGLTGRTLDGRYEVTAQLGKGGMGTVYRGLQISIGREVAIKVVHPHLARDKLAAKRFLRESKLASRLSHPNTVTLLDFGQSADGMLYMVMELLEGQTLDEVMGGGALALDHALDLAIGVCEALIAAHALEIVHRDLKPSNIVLTVDASGREQVRVLDFGLARSLAGDDTTVTKSDMLVGTPRYMAPELARGQRADTRADLYSLGVLLYEMVAGRPLFDASTIHAMLYAQVNDEPAPLPPETPTELVDLIGELLAKSADDRPADAGEVSRRLRALRERRAIAPTTAAASAAPDAPSRRGYLVALLLIAVAGAAGLAVLQRGGNDGDRTPAQPQAAPAVAVVPPTDAAASARPAPAVDAAPATITIEVDSAPTGAAVYRDRQLLCEPTPCDAIVEAGSGTAMLRLERRGYRDGAVRVPLDASSKQRVRLERKRRRPPPADQPDQPARPPGEDFLAPSR